MLGTFDRLGFWRHQRAFNPADLSVDLSSRAFLISGANSGIGYATAAGLAALGATVHLLCRDPARAALACESLRREHPQARLFSHSLDLGDLSAIRRFAASLPLTRIDGLIHNAGLLPDQRALSPQGIEQTLAVHVAGPQLLNRLLESRLRASPDARLIYVSSGGMYTQRLRLEDPHWDARPYDGVTAYAQTKRMQVILAEMWAEYFRGSAVSVQAMHPGWAETPSVQHSLPRFYRLTKAILRTKEQGADTVLWLAACPSLARHPGAFWFDRQPQSPYWLPWTRETPAERQQLWTLAETLSQRP
jgi:NAD(P)-dependent dehydrogenase (short-subunit alcohol dehydrogenase family)